MQAMAFVSRGMILASVLAWSAVGCGGPSGSNGGPRDNPDNVSTSFRCELGVVVDHHVDIYLDAEDWADGRAELNAHSFSNVNPRETIAFRITFVEPIITDAVSEETRFLISASATGAELSSIAANDIDPSLTYQGSLRLALSDAYFTGSANEGSLDGFVIDVGAPEADNGDMLGCMTVMMTVPSEFDIEGEVLPDQNLPFDSIVFER